MSEEMKKCMFCAEEIKAEARLCRFCNKEQVDPKAKSAEEIFYDGAVLHRTFIGEHVMFGAFAVAGLVGGVIYGWAVGGHSYALYIGLVMVFLGIGGSLVRVIKTSSLRWKITDQRVETERGIFSKKIDMLPLRTVEDIQYQQSLMQRILNEATIKLITNDKTTPVLSITGLTNHRALYERLRDAFEKRRREARVVTMESHPN